MKVPEAELEATTNLGNRVRLPCIFRKHDHLGWHFDTVVPATLRFVQALAVPEDTHRVHHWTVAGIEMSPAAQLKCIAPGVVCRVLVRAAGVPYPDERPQAC